MIEPVTFVENKDQDKFVCPICGKRIIKLHIEDLAILINEVGSPIKNKSNVREMFLCSGCNRDMTPIVIQDGIDFRFIERDKPFKVNITNPFTGEGCYNE